ARNAKANSPRKKSVCENITRKLCMCAGNAKTNGCGTRKLSANGTSRANRRGLTCSRRRSAASESFRQALRIERRVHFRVVIEINENVSRAIVDLARPNEPGVTRLSAFAPILDAIRPPIDFTIAVAADVKFFRAVQTDVNEIRGELLDVWPFAGRVCKDEGDFLFLEQFEELGR